MRIPIVLFMILGVLLAGCGEIARPERPPVIVDVLPQPGANGGLTEVVRTVVPVTQVPEQAEPPQEGYPVDEPVIDTEEAYPLPEEGQAADNLASQPYEDCTRTPGLPGCGAQADGLSGRLAVSDRSAGRLIVLDLSSGAGWQTQAQPGGLAWSPDGTRLLLINHSEGGEQYGLWGADGLQLPGPEMDGLIRWQPDGTLTGTDTVVSAQGDEARLERSQEGRWSLRLTAATAKSISVIISPQLADQIFVPLDWVPGGEQILAERSFASGAVLQMGGELVTIDPQTGQVEELDVPAPDRTAGMAWNPVQPGLLAVKAGSGAGAAGERGGAVRLALFDFNTRQLRDPLPAGLEIGGLAWSPDGQRLAFSVEAVGDLAPPEAADIFDGPGIFLLDPQTGQVERATQPPPGAQDGWPHWTPDGQLLFARLIVSEPDGAVGEVRARRLDTGEETVLFTGLPVESGPRGEIDWTAYLAFTPE